MLSDRSVAHTAGFYLLFSLLCNLEKILYINQMINSYTRGVSPKQSKHKHITFFITFKFWLCFHMTSNTDWTSNDCLDQIWLLFYILIVLMSVCVDFCCILVNELIWPIPFLINMLTALKGSHFYFICYLLWNSHSFEPHSLGMLSIVTIPLTDWFWF